MGSGASSQGRAARRGSRGSEQGEERVVHQAGRPPRHGSQSGQQRPPRRSSGSGLARATVTQVSTPYRDHRGGRDPRVFALHTPAEHTPQAQRTHTPAQAEAIPFTPEFGNPPVANVITWRRLPEALVVAAQGEPEPNLQLSLSQALSQAVDPSGTPVATHRSGDPESPQSAQQEGDEETVTAQPSGSTPSAVPGAPSQELSEQEASSNLPVRVTPEPSPVSSPTHSESGAALIVPETGGGVPPLSDHEETVHDSDEGEEWELSGAGPTAEGAEEPVGNEPMPAPSLNPTPRYATTPLPATPFSAALRPGDAFDQLNHVCQQTILRTPQAQRGVSLGATPLPREDAGFTVVATPVQCQLHDLHNALSTALRRTVELRDSLTSELVDGPSAEGQHQAAEVLHAGTAGCDQLAQTLLHVSNLVENAAFAAEVQRAATEEDEGAQEETEGSPRQETVECNAGPDCAANEPSNLEACSRNIPVPVVVELPAPSS